MSEKFYDRFVEAANNSRRTRFAALGYSLDSINVDDVIKRESWPYISCHKVTLFVWYIQEESWQFRWPMLTKLWMKWPVHTNITIKVLGSKASIWLSDKYKDILHVCRHYKWYMQFKLIWCCLKLISGPTIHPLHPPSSLVAEVCATFS